MTDNVALSWINRIDAAGVAFTAGSEVASLPAANLANPIVARPWQTSGTVSSYVEIDLGSAQSVQLLALAGLSGFATTDTIRARAHATRPTNLVLQSQTLDNGYWTKTASSISANAIAAPDGMTTADKLVEDGTTAVHGIYRASITGLTHGAAYTIGVFGKVAERTSIYMRADDASGGNEGTVVIATGAGAMSGTPPSGCTIEGTVLDNGWMLAEFKFPSLNGTTIDNLTIGAGNGSYAGDGSSGVYLWGVQVVEGTAVDGYVATTDAERTAMPDWLATIDSATDLTSIAGNVADGYGIWSYLAAAAASVRYLRFDINAASLTSQGFFRVGRAWAGPAMQPARSYSFGAEFGWRTGSRVSEGTRSGVVYPDARFRRRFARIELAALTEAEARDELLEMQRLAGVTSQVVLIPTPGSSRQPVEAILGYLRDLAPLRHRLPFLWAVPLEIEEAL